MNRFQKISALFQSVEGSVSAANRIDRAYAIGVGHPEYHENDFGPDNPQMVAMNVAGLYAADTGANLLAMDDDGGVTEEAYAGALRRIASKDLSPKERQTLKNVANATWRAGQPFRDITTKPLSRIGRDVNVQFNLLPPDEEDKDLVQVETGAQILLETIEKS